MASNTIDFETERLIIDIQRLDLTEDLRSTRDVLHISLIRDQLAALDAQSHEIQLRENAHAGQALQQSMYAAILADSRAIAEERHLEQQAVDDRVIAANLAGRPPFAVPELVQEQIASGQFDDARLTQLEETTSQRDLDAATESNDIQPPMMAGSLQAGAPNGQDHGCNDDGYDRDQFHSRNMILERYMALLSLDELHPAVECVVCLNEFPMSQTMTLACQDTWCRGCLTRLFEDSTLNEGVWPPKCCRREISINDVQQILSTGLRKRFALKSIEWSTVNRTYCHEPTCSAFIPLESIEGRKAECAACSCNTCANCKAAYHEDPQCSGITTDDEALTEVARVNGWQNCPNCRRFVEITHGCNHMT